MFGGLPIPRLEAARVCSTPPSFALAPGRSPIPSRLTHTPGARPLTGLPSGQEAGELQVASARASAAARIGEPCSATATPDTCREGEARRGTEVTTLPPPLPPAPTNPSRLAVTDVTSHAGATATPSSKPEQASITI